MAKRRQELMESCDPNKVRTYACEDDGTRMIKYFSYVYDFEEGKCMEKIKKKSVECNQPKKAKEEPQPKTSSFEEDEEEPQPKHSLSVVSKAHLEDMDEGEAEGEEEPDSAVELKKLNDHMGVIEGKVTDLSKKYDQSLKSNKGQMAQQNPEQMKKINKFAEMLKTLQSFKKQYKHAQSKNEKKTIHNDVMDFTKKWLDAKNLQIADSVKSN